MNWGDIAKLIIEIGIGAADKIITKWLTGTDPTAADWQEVYAMASKNSVDKLKEALTKAGFALDDPKAVAFLALLK